jgi:hypothetical protein
MTAVIRAIGFANGVSCPHAGEWLKSFDFEAFHGQGHGVFTGDSDEALRFDTKAEAMIFWRTQSRSKPWRPDGKPNRPLTALTVEIEELV